MLPTELLSGRSWTTAPELPLSLYATLGDLRPRFLAKCRVGTSYRAIARNGRVLLASDVSILELVDRFVRLRLQVWNRAILPGDVPEPFGILMDVRGVSRSSVAPLYHAHLIRASEVAAMALDVGGGLALAIEPLPKSVLKRGSDPFPEAS